MDENTACEAAYLRGYEKGKLDGIAAILEDLKGLLEGYTHKKDNITLYEFYCNKYGFNPKAKG